MQITGSVWEEIAPCWLQHEVFEVVGEGLKFHAKSLLRLASSERIPDYHVSSLRTSISSLHCKIRKEGRKEEKKERLPRLQ